ncbi:MAG: type II/IV secretion system protein [Microcoleus sp. PH2017_10_PVI_O_A]|uniref:GspE/PulE family protein n=1 Tax=unclassified Microcoleus TaxID=2642155 RepID=UPI001DCE7C2B|nr:MULTISPECIES: GspE/PulE family protein [unclassified Microcoleus]TAE85767.1 MAG: type II/IV secretion system protein [Oscillatoriales cyanobacterium]MCC3404225.1 type II/IV secretion system protein [Microcoleus sp. PH2017_10_PVI_O_A]MCC3458312.1 type II/IV secretion system protein [Microcoleus sp. PH2017_11_PCY_U_A]MCC3478383.1 type II/IV secretion system protein [Microcoleus sp. PH2017_12_PCY_D_A]MCC3527257.1 type II/IV secretion system protein [Microcoleus sp. PH2017_21_RUC_O_A]
MTNTSQGFRSTTSIVALSNFNPALNKMIQSGYVNGDQLKQAQIESRKSGKRLTEVLEALTGQPLPPELLRLYKKQQMFERKIVYGVEAYDPEMSEMSNEQLGIMLEGLKISIDICHQGRFLPVAKTETEPAAVLVAMVDPDNLNAIEDLRRILQPHGLALQRRVITPDDYQDITSSYQDDQVKVAAKLAEAEKQRKLELGEGDFGELSLEEDTADQEDLANTIDDAEAAPVIKAVNIILAKALSEKVSDIHVEPQEEFMRIRMRKDGVLQEYFRFPKQVVQSITARFKIIANLDIAERRQAQDGRIRRVFEGRTVDFRVNSLPSRYGEKIVLRILDSSSTQLGLGLLISDQETLALVRETASRPFGLILVTGPTGSGKSTSLYSILAERNDPGINISTAEDPIEYALPGITQCQVIREKDLTFSNILRAFLRQDPDVLLVGETRDKETAKTALEAALTGHLVLTTLHTNDAAGAIARLDEMGVEPFMVSAALLGVLAQRLMRRVCDKCCIPYQPTAEELGRYGLSASQEIDLTVNRANVVPVEERKELAERDQLCRKCSGLGYKGRVGVYEFLKNTERLQTLITQGAPTEQIKEAAVEEGMKTLLAYSLQLVREGATTFEEVERVTFTDSGLEAELKAKRKQGLTCKSCRAELKPEMLDCPYCLTPRFLD